MNTQTSPLVLLAAIDESAIADVVLEQTAKLARATPGAELHVVHVPERFTHAPITSRTFNLDEGRRFLDDAAKRLQAATGARVIGHLVERDAAHAVLQVAASIDADLVIVGAHDRHGPERWLLGSVAEKIARRAACSVIVARPKAHRAEHAPEIEPPCPDCVRAQRASGGREMWCARHSQHHPHAHVHYELPEGFGAGSSLIRS